MRETLIEANGLGLAAPQVGILRRVVLIVDTSIDTGLPEVDFDELSEEQLKQRINEEYNKQIIELINPEIINQTGEQSGSEGCLSVPGVYALVLRPETVTVRAQDRNGKFFDLEVTDLAARAACHEVDHLEGVIFTSVAEKLLSEEELAELAAEEKEKAKNKTAIKKKRDEKREK